MNIASSVVNDRGLTVPEITLDRIIVRISICTVYFDRHRRRFLASDGMPRDWRRIDVKLVAVSIAIFSRPAGSPPPNYVF